MLDAMAAVQMQEISVHTVGGKPQTRSAEPHAHSYIRAPYGVFETADHYIVVAFASLDAFGTLIGEPSFAGMDDETDRSEEHTSDLQSLMRISYAVFCCK